ncbi:TIGR03086 family protein [Streptomyces sp. A0958]|uniref:TIGR03086 family metal-binding protein n=1 Tax=Streptomyces sp. A0958 TaxID=2563101 RepID=UPI00109E3867|nr:TIGR03086 family metal-binding protein [Streptomyces sp. A0958]THA64207.1 TIGR03086 family protein [Streptomyces sp. A0958]
MDIIRLDRIAVLESVRVVDRAGPGDWDRPTPCDRWTLRLLVEHMGTQHLGFAAAARGEGADGAAWAPRPAGDDPAAWYRGTARTVLDAFARPEASARRFALPEVSTGATFSATTAMGFHFIDYVVHSWDVAAALGLPTALPEAVTEAALPLALRVPDGPARERPDAAFRPALAAGPRTGRADPLALTLAALGRSPDWRPPQGG